MKTYHEIHLQYVTFSTAWEAWARGWQLENSITDLAVINILPHQVN